MLKIYSIKKDWLLLSRILFILKLTLRENPIWMLFNFSPWKPERRIPLCLHQEETVKSETLFFPTLQQQQQLRSDSTTTTTTTLWGEAAMTNTDFICNWYSNSQRFARQIHILLRWSDEKSTRQNITKECNILHNCPNSRLKLKSCLYLINSLISTYQTINSSYQDWTYFTSWYVIWGRWTTVLLFTTVSLHKNLHLEFLHSV